MPRSSQFLFLVDFTSSRSKWQESHPLARAYAGVLPADRKRIRCARACSVRYMNTGCLDARTGPVWSKSRPRSACQRLPSRHRRSHGEVGDLA